jgi:hypothetical protein
VDRKAALASLDLVLVLVLVLVCAREFARAAKRSTMAQVRSSRASVEPIHGYSSQIDAISIASPSEAR